MAQELYDSYTGTVTDNGGNVISGATIEVYNAVDPDPFSANNTLATIYSDRAGTNAVDQGASPLQSDSSGRFTFYADAGYYHIIVSNGSEQDAIPDVPVGTAKSLDAEDTGSFEVLESITGNLVVSDTVVINVSTAIYEGSASLPNIQSMYWSNAGSYIYVQEFRANTRRHPVTTPYDIGTIQAADQTVDAEVLLPSLVDPEKCTITEDGRYMLFTSRRGASLPNIVLAELTTPYDMTTMVEASARAYDSALTAVISSDGRYLYWPRNNSSFPYVYIDTLDQAFNIDNSNILSTDVLNPADLGIPTDPGGTSIYVSEQYLKLFIGISSNDSVYEVDVDSVSLSNPVYTGRFSSLPASYDNITSIYVDEQSVNLYVGDNVDDDVSQYSIGAPAKLLEAPLIGVLLGAGDVGDNANTGQFSVTAPDGDNAVISEDSLSNGSYSDTVVTKQVVNGERVERYNGFNVWRKP